MDHAATERRILQTETRWAWFTGAMVALILVAILYAGIAMQINPPSNREFIDPKTLHLSGEFTEDNLGTSVEPFGQPTVRMITTQFAFVPQCVVVPANRPVGTGANEIEGSDADTTRVVFLSNRPSPHVQHEEHREDGHERP